MPEPRFPDAKGRAIPILTQHLVADRDGHLCQYCGSPDDPSYDHVFPWGNGGTHDPRNLVIACGVCNSIAGLRVFSEFAAKKRYILARRDQIGKEGIATLTATLRSYGPEAVRALENAAPERPTGIPNETRKDG